MAIPRFRLIFLVTIVAAISLSKLSMIGARSSDAQQKPSKQASGIHLFDAIRISPGTQQEAEAYYAAISQAAELGLPLNIGSSTLDDLIKYCGFEGLLAADVEKLGSDIFRDYQRLKSVVSNPMEFARRFDGFP